MCKYFVVFALAAVASAGVMPVSQYASTEPEAPAHYEFQYSVNNNETGDMKQHQESRAGDVVHGSYSLVQPDGVHRIVNYTSDAAHGFIANVSYEGQPTQAPVTAKIAYVAPVAEITTAAPVAKIMNSAPIYHGAPLAKMAHAAPHVQVSYSSPAMSMSYHH